MLNVVIARQVIDICSEYFQYVAYDTQRSYVSLCCWGRSRIDDQVLKRIESFVRKHSVKSTFRWCPSGRVLNIKMRF